MDMLVYFRPILQVGSGGQVSGRHQGRIRLGMRKGYFNGGRGRAVVLAS